ncbi:peptidoglycan D,D-transpeptidase FtsI family protein [Patescibacteria group bacterium]
MKYKYKKNTQNFKKTGNWRINIFALFVFLFIGLIIFRLFKLQVIDSNFYEVLASGQHEFFEKLVPHRGSIFIHNYTLDNNSKKQDLYEGLYPVAVNKKYNFVYVEPIRVEDQEKTTEALSRILEFDETEKEVLIEKLSRKDDPYEPLEHKVENNKINKIKSLGLKGVNYIEEYFRHYPDNNIGGHIIGFVGYADEDNKKGQYGIEGYFNKLLSGELGFIKTEKDVLGKMLKTGYTSFSDAVDGDDIVLTLDYGIQHTICVEIKKGIVAYGADSGTVIVMDPYTGAILGMCSYPDFNPEKYNEVDNIKIFNNPAIFHQYEPGSVFKPITAAIALDLDVIKPDTVYNDTGEVKIGPDIIKNSDFKAHGNQTMTEVLESSLNTGAIYMARKIGKDNFKSYIEKFGFGEITGIELDSEAKGNIASLAQKGEIYMATASFGQGISVTAIQMLSAYSALANGGKLPKPYILDSIIRNKQEKIDTKPKIVRQVISERASTLVTAMMTSVIESGHAKHAGVKNYYVAGKTGTAQVAEKGGYGEKTIHSFIGFAPVDEPKFVMLVQLDNPKNVQFSASSSAPIFGTIAEFLLKYYGVKPTR